VEALLLEQGRKYNLSKVLANFMGELKEAIVSGWMGETVAGLLRNSGD
jgi:hypothetical protein